MRFMFVVALIFAAVVACLPWINVSLDEAGLRQDAAFAPELSRSGRAISARAVAHYLMRVAKERGLDLKPENMTIEVGGAEPGTLGVQGGPLKVQGNQLVTIQKVTITIDYTHPVYLGFTRRMAFTINTEGIGDGGRSTFPSPTPQQETEEPSDEPEAPSAE
jgi:hypothetical protein